MSEWFGVALPITAILLIAGLAADGWRRVLQQRRTMKVESENNNV
jgi:hypothetical protein